MIMLSGLCCQGVALTVAAVVAADTASAETPSKVDQVKAAFVLNIARFVKWPETGTAGQQPSLMLCLYHDDPFGSAISTIQGKRVNERRLDVRKVDSLEAAADCGILLVGADLLDRYSEEARNGLPGPILTIADQTDAPQDSSPTPWILVKLVRRGDRIGFEVHLARVRFLGLQMSSELLKLARIIGNES